jgi:hypothetical protein
MTGPWDRLMSARAIFAIHCSGERSVPRQSERPSSSQNRVISSPRQAKAAMQCTKERDLKAHAFRGRFMSVRYGLGQSDQNKPPGNNAIASHAKPCSGFLLTCRFTMQVLKCPVQNDTLEARDDPRIWRRPSLEPIRKRRA